MVKHKVVISVPDGNIKGAPKPKEEKGIFAPANSKNEWHEFILGHVLTGIFLGLGTALGTVAVRALIKKYNEDHHEDSFLAKGL